MNINVYTYLNIYKRRKFRKEAKKEKKKNKGPATLPWWCKIIAYILAAAFAFVSLFMVYIKGLILGNAEVTKWVTSLVVSLFSGIFITQPIQVAVIAFIFVLIFRKPGDERDDLAENYCDERLAELQVKGATNKLGKGEDLANTEAFKRLTFKEKKDLTEIRHKRMIEKKMYRAVAEIIIFAIFLFFVAIVSMQNQNQNSFKYQTALTTFFQSEDFGGLTFGDIEKVDDVWTFMQNVFKKSLDASTWYNGNETLNMTHHLFDFQSVLIGNVSVRQQRMSSKVCPHFAERITHREKCIAEYSALNREKNNYTLSWNSSESRNLNESTNITDDVFSAFEYKSSKVISIILLFFLYKIYLNYINLSYV